MNETPFFFPNIEYNLFGILHTPVETANRQGFVFVHPFVEEKLWAHRVLVDFARELAKKGYFVLRFDFFGHGDSDGNFEDSSVESRLNDIECALQFLRANISRLDKIGLLGLRLGATLAAVAAERNPDIDKLVLWDPILDGNRYMKNLLRSNLATQNAVYKEIRFTRDDMLQIMRDGGNVNVDGYLISHELYKQVAMLNLTADLEKKFIGDCLIIQTRGNRQKVKRDLEPLASLYTKSKLLSIVEEPFWKEIKSFYARADNLAQATMDWMG